MFGKMEIEGLANRRIQPIQHFYDILKKPPISFFDNSTVRIQDFLLNLRTVYGSIQGYYFSDQIMDLSEFVERLAYTREIYVCLQMTNNLDEIQKRIFPLGVKGKNFQYWISSHNNEKYCLFRIVTNMFFLEQLNNVVLCSAGKTRARQITRMKDNINRLTFHIMENIKEYVPKFPKDYNWKEFEDFIDEPKEITLYLTQFYGPPYKAKFHPRMIRSLLNFAGVTKDNVTGDFMLGSGTLAIESVLLNLCAQGSDVNPLTKIVTNAKIDALEFKRKSLLAEIDKILDKLLKKTHLAENKPDFSSNYFKGKERFRDTALEIRECIETDVDEKYRDFFLCALASVISTGFKKKNEPDLFQMIGNELWQMWKMVYCINEIREFLHFPIGKKEIHIADVRKESIVDLIGENQIDLIVTSPPYSTAIDYVKMDFPQLLLLGLIENAKELDEKMMGTRRKTSDIETLAKHIIKQKQLVFDSTNRFNKLPLAAQKYISDLQNSGNKKNALRCYKFLYDMWDALTQMHRILKPGGRCIIIIGNNVFKVDGKKREFRNGDFLEEIALNEEVGFSKWRQKLVREYSKSSYGTILKEDIIFLKKD